MKDSSNTAKKLLDLPYAPEAEQYLDELERSGQFRVGLEAEIEDAEAGDASAGNDYALGPRLRQRLDPGLVDLRARRAARRRGHLHPATSSLARINDSLVMRTQDGLDRAGARGLPRPDSRTPRRCASSSATASEWAGAELLRASAAGSPKPTPRQATRTRSSLATSLTYGSKST